MAFRFVIGSNARDAGEVHIESISKEIIRSPRGTRRYMRETWDLSGEIQVEQDHQIDPAMLAFEALLTDGSDVRFVNGQNQQTAHVIRSADTMGGVHIESLRWGASRGAEHSNYRSYSLRLEATHRVARASDLVEFRESISFIGDGGPEVVWLTLVTGPPQRQRVNERTTCRAIQSGHAVGEFSRPNPLVIAPPLWPGQEHRTRRVIEKTGPMIVNGERTDHGIRWQYEFESDRPLLGEPHVS